MIWRFLCSLAFHAAGGEVLDGGAGRSEVWLRGERRSEVVVWTGAGDMGAIVGFGGASVAGITGEERHERSIASTTGEGSLVASG